MRDTGLTRLGAILLAGATACGGGGGDTAVATPTPPTTARSANVKVGNAATGRFDVLVSTIVDATWESWLFQRFPNATTLLADMGQQHMLIVVDENTYEQVVPQVGRDPSSRSSWDFTKVDAIVQPMLAMGDRSPDLMIGAAPPHMYDANHKIVDLAGFAEYAANLVRYYNGPGIRLNDGTTLRSASAHPITYWSILNETNLSGNEYLALYDRVVPAMLKADPTIRLVAAEIAWGNAQQVNAFLSPFLQGVTSRVDVLGMHFFPAGQQDPDQRVFDYVPESAANLRSVYAKLAGNPRLVQVPVWVTSYNSTCWGATDPRPTSAFYAAWGPYLFSRLGQAGARSFHHWEFAANVQYGEIDQETGRPFIAYWIDYWLGRYFSTPAGQDTLSLVEQTDPANVETLAVRRADGSVVVMVVDHAVSSAADNNGKGVSYTVNVDLGALGSFRSATELTIDANTDPAAGPAERSVPLARSISLSLAGYGVAFLSLRP
jgi:hypothetical protein